MENKKPEVRLTGRWRLHRTFTITAAQEKYTTIFQDRQYIVDFSDDGVVTESVAGKDTTTAYHYDPATRTVSIEQSGCDQPSPVSGKVKNAYRIIPLNETEMYLMSPPSIEEDSVEFELILLERI